MDYKDGGIPKTIEELKDYCERNGFTSSVTRFFVGFDYKGPRAFGIYKDEATGEFVVYKNKADGSRAVRYRGTDEEFAVVELYDRLQQEIANQKLHYAAEMAERERNKYERGVTSSDEHADSYEYIKNFHASDYPLNSFVDNVKSYNDDSSYSYGGERRRPRESGGGGLGTLISIAIIIIYLLMGLAGIGGGFGGGGSYHSGYDSGYSSYDSGWGSDWDSGDWDSGYTDWDSDW